jgi:putative ABC transport system permease protein
MLRRLYRVLLVLYPRDVRARFGRDMLEVFDDLMRSSAGRNAMAWRAILELPRSAMRARWERRRRGHTVDSTRGNRMETVWQDLRYAVRGLLRQPGLAGIAVLSLALGIGANTSMISMVRAVVWTRLPVPEPERVIRIHEYEGRYTNFAYANYRDVRQSAAAFDGVAVHNLNAFAINHGDATEVVFGELVSANYFETLRVSAAHGRTFTTAEGETRQPVVVLSHVLWQRMFRGRLDVLGASIRLNGHPMTVIGVTNADFPGTKFGLGMDLWVPIETWGDLQGWGDWMDARGSHWLEVVARLAPGVTMEQAQRELEALAARLAVEHVSTNANCTFRVAAEHIPDPEVAGLPQLIGVLAIAASGMVLVVACANVASLLLARGVTRRRELRIRRALGASRGRITRQLMTEALVLAGTGGFLGISLAHWTSGLLWWFAPALPYRFAIDTSPDAGVLALAATVTITTAFLFGLIPALHASRVDEIAVVRGSAAGSADARTARHLRVVVTTMLALAFVTLLLTGLFTRSLAHARSLDPGFASSGRLLATVDASLAGYDAARSLEYFEHVLLRVRAIPGVRAAAMGETMPLGDASSSSELFAADRSYAENDLGVNAIANRVSLKFFAAMDIPLLRGRRFTTTDRSGSPSVIVINATLAERFWPDGEAVGRRVRFAPTGGSEFEVVGVVGDGRYVNIAETQRPAYYQPLAQAPRRSMELIVATAMEPADLAAPVRAATAAVDPLVPVHNLRTISEHLASSLWMFRLGAGLGAALGGLALVLAGAGLYGVLTFAVNQRRRELGLRIALGARGGQVMRMVLRQSFAMVGLGVVLGGVVALAAGGPLQAALVGVQPRDPLTFIGVIVVLLGVTLLASLWPARVAVRADPVTSLRVEG